MNKKEFLNEMAKPFIVLVCICLVAAGLLAFIHKVTAPVIEENALAQAEATRKEVLPSATAFEEIALTDTMEVDSIYKDAGGSGYVVTASVYGYHGDVTVTIGFDSDRKILALSADVSSETSGVGTKAGQDAYLSKYIGLSEGAENVDLISGATYSSNAVRTAVENAIAALGEIN